MFCPYFHRGKRPKSSSLSSDFYLVISEYSSSRVNRFFYLIKQFHRNELSDPKPFHLAADSSSQPPENRFSLKVGLFSTRSLVLLINNPNGFYHLSVPPDSYWFGCLFRPLDITMAQNG
jgi:hypothetical protein